MIVESVEPKALPLREFIRHTAWSGVIFGRFCTLHPGRCLLSKKNLRLVCFVLSACLFLVAQTPNDLYKKYAPAVVLIQTLDDAGKVKATGTGFIVSPDGKILTNFHVIAHTKTATVRLANEDAYDEVEVLDIDKRKDIALIKIKAVELPTVVIGKSSPVQVGDSAFSLSNPLGILQNTLSSGIVSGIRLMDGFRYFQISTPISHGSSGGPLFNTEGQVIGITTAMISEGQNLNFAVPIDYAKGMLAAPGEPKALSSIYEPEPEPTATETEKSDQPAVAKTSSPTDDLRKQGPYNYLQTKFGVWTLGDAKRELGAPVRETSLKDSDVYAFPDPTNLFREVSLFFSRKSGLLTIVSFAPWNLSWRQCKETLGTKYWREKKSDGNTSYMYKDRPVNVLVDGREQVVSIGVFCNSCH